MQKMVRLDSDEEIIKAIDEAKKGSLGKAWFLITQLERRLEEFETLNPTFTLGARFFTALLELHEDYGDAPTTLATAFDVFEIRPGRGRRRLSDAGAGKAEASQAWQRIDALAEALSHAATHKPLFHYAARFFRSLSSMNVRGGVTLKSLSKLLGELHVVRSKGQPARDPMDRHVLSARVTMVVEAGLSLEAAVGELGHIELPGDEALTDGAYQIAYDDLDADAVNALLTLAREYPNEIAAIGGFSSFELICLLICNGMPPPKELADFFSGVSR